MHKPEPKPNTLVQPDKSISSEKLWTAGFIRILFISVSAGMAMQMLMPTLPMYLLDLGSSESSAGMVTTIFALSALLFRPLFGNLTDKYGRRPVLIIGLFVFTLSIFQFIFFQIVIVIMLFRFLNGAGFSGYSTAAGATVSDVVPKQRLAEGIGYFGLFNTLAMAAGPAIGLALIARFSYTALFIAASFFCMLSLVLSLFIHESQSVQAARKIDKQPVILFEKTALPASLVLLFVAFSFSSITFLPAYAANLSIPDIGLYFTIFALAVTITRLFVGKLADQHGMTLVMIPGILLTAATFFVFSQAEQLSAFLLAAALYGIGFGTVQPSLHALIVQMCPEERRGAGNAAFFSTMDIGVGSGAFVWGFLLQMSGFPAIYTASLALSLIALIMYLFLFARKSSRYNKAVAKAKRQTK